MIRVEQHQEPIQAIVMICLPGEPMPLLRSLVERLTRSCLQLVFGGVHPVKGVVSKNTWRHVPAGPNVAIER